MFRLRFLAAKLQKEIGFDIVHCRSYLTSLVGWWMKRKFKIGFIFDMRGFWADERVDGRIWDLRSSLYREIYSFFKKREIEFLIHADAVISLTRNAKAEITNWFANGVPNVKGSAGPEVLDRTSRHGQRLLALSGQHGPRIRNLIHSKIAVIPTCVDEDSFNLPHHRDPGLISGLGISKDDYVLLYLGSLGTWYLLPQMMDFYLQLRRIKPSAKFLIITNDPTQFWDKQGSRFIRDERNNSAGVIVKNLPFEKVPQLGAVADLGICFIKPSFSKMASCPTKIGEMLALGIPVISNRGYGDVAEVINPNCGFIINQFSKKEYRRIVKSLDTTRFDPAAIRSQGLDLFSLKHGIQKYHLVYQRILSTPES